MVQHNTKLTPAQVKQMFEKIVTDTVEMSPDEIDLHTSFANGLGLDSLDEVELLMKLEQEFQIQISDEETHALYGATIYEILEACVKYLVAAQRLTKQDADTLLRGGSVFNKKNTATTAVPKMPQQHTATNTKPQPQMVTIPKSLLDEYTATLKRANALAEQIKQYTK